MKESYTERLKFGKGKKLKIGEGLKEDRKVRRMIGGGGGGNERICFRNDEQPRRPLG